jgi:hypothetical protein
MDKRKQTNTPEDWRILAERDISVADYLANTMVPMEIRSLSPAAWDYYLYYFI